jgi:LacI family transcriptional regulator
MSRKESDPKAFPSRPHVALIVETSHASGRAILRGITRYINENGPWSVYHEPRSLDGELPSWLADWQGDGIIVRAQNPRIAENVLRTGIPAVDVLGVAAGCKLPLVHVDNRKISRLAAEHFLERGFKNFAFCGIAGLNWSEERGGAFQEAICEQGFSCEISMLPATSANDSWEQSQDRLGDWLSSLPKPVAVMTSHDPIGQRVLDAARRVRALVPEEIAVIGVDNDETLCAIADPPLSSIKPGHTWVGYHAASLLCKLMAGDSTPATAIFAPTIGCVTRHSSDVSAIEDSEVAQAVSFIREHACEKIGVQDVVDYVSISRSALKRRFAKQLDRGIHDEIIRVRMERAQQLLAETELPISRIAVTIGYEHIEYFSVAFRREIGETPVAYRQRVRAN